jgi:hypothetical protein
MGGSVVTREHSRKRAHSRKPHKMFHAWVNAPLLWVSSKPVTPFTCSTVPEVGGPAPCCSLCTTRTTASSITSLPPTPSSGEDGEYLTVDPLPSSAGGIAGPIGLGVRVPMIVVSPFSAGGWVCSDIFDHTSQLQFLASLFNLTVPNVSAWRQSTVGNLMSTLPVLDKPVVKVPKFAAVSDNESSKLISNECNSEQLLELNPNDGSYPVPKKQKIPKQVGGHLKPTPT